MTEQTATTTTTSESDRTKYNRRLREKRTKGHSLQMIADYALKCPVPIEQLDMTPEEKAEIERMRKKEVNKVMDHISWRRQEIANYVLESGVPIDQLELLPGELAEIADTERGCKTERTKANRTATEPGSNRS
jgi:hypothetical protein